MIKQWACKNKVEFGKLYTMTILTFNIKHSTPLPRRHANQSFLNNKDMRELLCVSGKPIYMSLTASLNREIVKVVHHNGRAQYFFWFITFQKTKCSTQDVSIDLMRKYFTYYVHIKAFSFSLQEVHCVPKVVEVEAPPISQIYIICIYISQDKTYVTLRFKCIIALLRNYTHCLLYIEMVC